MSACEAQGFRNVNPVPTLLQENLSGIFCAVRGLPFRSGLEIDFNSHCRSFHMKLLAEVDAAPSVDPNLPDR